MYKNLTKVELGREMAARKIIGSASIFTGSSLRWTGTEWTGRIDYGPNGLGCFTREEMIKALQDNDSGRPVRFS